MRNGGYNFHVSSSFLFHLIEYHCSRYHNTIHLMQGLIKEPWKSLWVDFFSWKILNVLTFSIILY